MPDSKHHLAALVAGARHLADRALIASFIGDGQTAFSANPFPTTSAGAVRHVWSGRAFEFRTFGVEAAGLGSLLEAVSALDPSAPLFQHILRSGPHTLYVFGDAGGDRAVGAVLYGKPRVPLPALTVRAPPPPPRGRRRAAPAQLDLFAAHS